MPTPPTRIRTGIRVSPTAPTCSPPSGKAWVQYVTVNGDTYVYDSEVRPRTIGSDETGITVFNGRNIPPLTYGQLDLYNGTPVNTSTATTLLPGVQFNCIYYNPSPKNDDFMFNVMPKIVEGIVVATGVVTALGLTGALGATSGVPSSLGAATASASSTVVSTASSVASGVSNIVNQVAGVVKDVIGPISSVLGSISHEVMAINDGIIQPIVGPIKTISSEYSALTSELHGDIKQGIMGIINIPSQLSGALTTVSNSFQTAVQQLDLFNRQTMAEVLMPGIGASVGQPLTSIAGSFPTDEDIKKSNAVFDIVDSIGAVKPNEEMTSVLDKLTGIIKEAASGKNFILSAVYNAVYFLEFIPTYLYHITKPYEYYANTQNPYTLLDPNTVIEAMRRGLLNGGQGYEELLQQGYSAERAKLMYDVVQYLFDPKSAVDLKARGIISDAQFNEIMSQNNLDAGQASALVGLMEFIFSPGEVAQLYNRGIITEDVYNGMMLQNRVGSTAQDIIKQLSLKPLSGRDSVIMDGRLGAKSDNFLPDTLGTKLPETYKTLYQANQTEESQGELDWLAHWRLPGNEWWVEAVWRGLRTKEEAYEAFKANNTPQELYEDQFGVMEELPPVWLVPDVLGTGVWPKDKAVQTFLKLGFSEENANVLADYGLSKLNAGSKAAADTLHGLSLTSAKDLYESEAIGKDEYLAILKDHGVGDTASKLTVELTDIQNNLKERNDYVTYVIDTVKAGQVTEQNALADLATKGYTEAQRVAAQLKMVRAKTLAQKIPTKAELKDFLNMGLINDNQFYQFMTDLGYNHDWILVYYEYYTGKPAPPGIGAV